jgi:hypothetical protein
MSASGQRPTGLQGAGHAIMTHKQFQKNALKMKTNSSLAGNVLTTFELKIADLAKEIAADEKGIQDYEQRLYLLNKEKDLLQKRIRRNAQFAADFDKMIGPFSDKYTDMTKEMATLYGQAKEHHMNGVMLLVREFDYHPLFKRRDNEFTAAPFKPK